jgi:hypothetical protein
MEGDCFVGKNALLAMTNKEAFPILIAKKEKPFLG